MANDIRIGVSADTSGLSTDLGKVDGAARKTGESIGGIGKHASDSAKGIQELEISARRLERAVAMLSREFGKAVDPKQAEQIMRNWDSMRANKHLSGGSKIRQFESMEKWMEGSGKLFVNPVEAQRHQRHILNLASQGTGLSPIGGVHQGDGQGSGSRPGHQHPVVQRGASAATGAARGVMGLAGVMGVMAMAGRAVDLAKEEAMAQDQLLRGTGDLKREFDHLRAQVRRSGDEFGVAYVEAAGMARHYAKIANPSDDLNIGENVRTGFGMARAYGLELDEGVSFMGEARHFGAVDGDDNYGRRFAAMIAEAIERGQATAKAGEMLQAIASYTSTIARHALTAPNVAGFAGALAGLTSTHTPGLDPSGAANLLSAADAAMRRGGGMGEAGQNFTYGALLRENPGINPIMAMAVAEQGLFGSGADFADSPYAKMMERQGLTVPEMSGRTNFEVARGLIDQQYPDTHLRADAYRNYFGLSSLQHGAALANMDSVQLGGVDRMLARSGVDVRSITASGIQNLGAIAGADEDGLMRIMGRLVARDDATPEDEARFRKALEEGGMEGLRDEMAKFVASFEQEKNVATDTRDGVAQLNNTLTALGNGLLPVLSGIQRGVSAMAGAIAPDSDYAREIELERGANAYERQRADHVASIESRRAGLDQWYESDKERYPNKNERVRELERERRAARIEADDDRFWGRHGDEEAYRRNRQPSMEDQVNRALEELNRREEQSGGGRLNLGDDDGAGLTPSEKRVSAAGQLGPVKFTPDQLASMERAAGGDPEILQMVQSFAALENWGFGRVRSNLTSPAGAQGPFQFMPGTASAYGLQDPTDFDQSAVAAAAMARDLHRQYGGDMRAAMAHYNGGTRAGRAVAAGGLAPAAETRQYVDRFDQLNGGALPRGHSPNQGQRDQVVRVDLGNPTFRLEDHQGNSLADPVSPNVRVLPPMTSGVAAR